MLIALPILLFLSAPLSLRLIQQVRPRFAFYWLTAAVTALVAWPLVLLAGLNLPRSLQLAAWQPVDLLRASPALRMDETAWALALGLAVLALSVILTGVTEAPRANWPSWSASLVLCGVGLIAVLSANLLTLLLAWAALDLAQLLILLQRSEEQANSEAMVIAFSTRAAGLMLLLWAFLTAAGQGQPLELDALSPASAPFLLLAAVVRISSHYLDQEDELRAGRGLGTLLALVPAAASLTVVVRAAAPALAPWQSPLLWTAGLVGLVSAVEWLRSEDESRGRPAWISGMAALVIASALRGQPAAALAWAMALLLSGGLLFLTALRPRRLLILALLGWVGMTALPFTPAWEGVRLYSLPPQPLDALFLLTHALLMAGYLRHAIRIEGQVQVAERWIWLIYPWGLGLLPITHLLQDWLRGTGTLPALSASWPAGVSLALLGIMGLARRYPPKIPARFIPRLERQISFRWFFRLLWGFYRSIARASSSLNQILEGEGGFLWTLLLLVLLLSFLSQLTGSGG